ncbi:MAG: NADH-quinone oxidoreductase subunit N [Anaerolineae bacterium]|nr:NADH-quinone oxidoreductase subunit N [Anaerolineae bacterium]
MPIDFPTIDVTALLPEIIVIITALLVMLFDLFISPKRGLGHLSLLGLTVAAIACLMLLGASPAPAFQNMAVSDGYSLILNLIFIVTAALSVLVAMSYLTGQGMQRGEYYTLLLFAVSGMMLMGAATDLIIVFLGLEIMSIALYILAAFNRRQMASGEAGLKYFVLGAYASAFFLYGVALIYGATGSTNLHLIGRWFTQNPAGLSDPMALVGLGLLLVGFAFKIAAVPFQWWTPDVYHGAPTSVTAFMSVGAKAAGFAALIRLLMSSFGQAFAPDWQLAVAGLAVVTMTGGNMAALAQKDVKRMLAYSSIAHAGYILVGVASATMTGVYGVLFYLMAYAFMNLGAFAVIAVLERRHAIGSVITDYAGLAARRPLVALVMAFFMFSLTGLPPFIGFWGKLYVFGAAVAAGLSWLVVVGVLNSAVSAFYYVAVVVQMYMHSPRSPEEAAEAEAPPLNLSWPVTVTLAVAGTATLLLGLWPAPLWRLILFGVFG